MQRSVYQETYFSLPQHFKRTPCHQASWKDLYQAAVDGNLSLLEHHISEKVNPNY